MVEKLMDIRTSEYWLSWFDRTLAVISDYAINVIASILVIFLAHFISAQIKKFYKKHLYQDSSNQVHNINSVIAFTLRILCLLIGYFIAIHLLGLQGVLTQILASAGVIGIVVGFATKETIGNFFSGMLVNILVPFKVNDWVNINGQYGCVEKIGTFVTTVLTEDGQRVHIPNQLIYSQNVINYSSLGKRVAVVSTGVSYGDDLQKVKAVALDEIGKLSGLLLDEENQPHFFFTEIGASTYNFELRVWVEFIDHDQYLECIHQMIMAIKKRFEQEDISIAYNVTTLDFGVKGGVNLYDNPIQIKQLN